MISIIVTAYQAQDFLEECLTSIFEQNYYDRYEVLLGIDACEETMKKYEEMRSENKLPEKFSAIYMTENVGTYVTTNTLVSLAQGDYILRFDSDDIMMPEMLSKFMEEVNYKTIVQFSAIEIQGNKKRTRKNMHGCLGYEREVFNKLGGYKAWRCAADTDFIKRAAMEKIPTKVLKNPTFYRRWHPNSLTSNKESGYGSGMRKALASKVGLPKESDAPTIGKFIRL